MLKGSLRIVTAGIVAASIGWGVSAQAASVTHVLNQNFGAVPPSGSPTLTIDDGDTAGSVTITMDLSALTLSEKVGSWYFNTDSDPNSLGLVWTYDAGASTGPAAIAINTVSSGDYNTTNDASFKADGDGFYDIVLDFNTGGTLLDIFEAGEKVVYDVTGTGILASTFGVLGTASDDPDAPGPFITVARVLSTGADGEGSDWIGVGDPDFKPPVVPLPAAAWMGMMMLGGLGVIKKMRDKKLS